MLGGVAEPLPALPPSQISQAIEEVHNTNRELLRKYRRELQLRKKCHNELVRLKGVRGWWRVPSGKSMSLRVGRKDRGASPSRCSTSPPRNSGRRWDAAVSSRNAAFGPLSVCQ